MAAVIGAPQTSTRNTTQYTEYLGTKIPTPINCTPFPNFPPCTLPIMSTIQIKPFYAVYPGTSDAPRVASVPYDVVSKEEASIIASQNEESFMHVVRSEVES